MNIYKMSKEDLELLSFTDIAYEILKKANKPETTIALFKSIAQLLDLSDDIVATKIGDFYTTLTTDKRFLALSNGEWDLKEKHTIKVVIDDDEDFDVEIDDVEKDEISDDENNNIDSVDYDSTDDYEDNGLDDLVVIDENENFDE